ncbi:MAG: glycosyltransferase family 2 protein [Solirubrobacterales bacterium]|jgi:glycosyltransferase involved in cell wall biosynthesis|nr:glycosyltransferase family 2 protein [Solirubrobacterales bacterium]
MPRLPTQSSSQGVSVVIPTKDRARLLEQTLRSVGQQTLPPSEVIVADDGSTDDTEAVIRAAGARHVRNTGSGWGPSAARNAGLSAASCAAVSFIDSDDLLHPRALERLYGALRSQPGAPFAFGHALVARRGAAGWSAEGVIRPGPGEREDYLCSLFVRNSVPSGGALVDREIALDLGGFDTRMVFAEDHAFWLSLARRGEPAYVPEIVCIHRRHGGNRWTPAMSPADEQLIDVVAEVDDRLSECLPRRRGVQLCEVSIDALHKRSPRQLLAGVSRLLLGNPHRVQILRAAAWHFRMRRRGPGVDGAPLEEDVALRDWLATY